MLRATRVVPARLQAAMALLERLREDTTLDIQAHIAAKGSSGLKSHETYGDRAHQRFNLDAINKIHGRRSSNLGEWGPILLQIVRKQGFARMSSDERSDCIDSLQQCFATRLRAILEEEPLTTRISGRSAEAAIRELIEQADMKGKGGEVAQYLVGAKLELRFGREFPIVPSNKGDRRARGDQDARLGDFEFENSVIEVALGLPDTKHLTQISDAIDDTEIEIWLLTRTDRVDTWKKELQAMDGLDLRRVVVTSVESFVGQNITELGQFSTKGKAKHLRELFQRYNDRWVAQVGTPGIRVDVR